MKRTKLLPLRRHASVPRAPSLNHGPTDPLLLRPLSSATMNAGSASGSRSARIPSTGISVARAGRMLTFPEDVVLLLLDDEEGVFLSVGKSTLELALTGSVLMELGFAHPDRHRSRTPDARRPGTHGQSSAR